MRVLVLLVVLGLCGQARAEEDPFLARARELMDEAEYKKAAKVIRQGLAREEVGGAELVEHYLLEAICNVSLGKTGQAKSSFAKLLTINPRYRLDSSVSPKVRDVFEEALAAVAETSDPASSIVPVHIPVGTRTPGAPVAVKLGFTGDGATEAVAAVTLYVRRQGTSEFVVVDAVRQDDTFVAEIPALFVKEEGEVYAIEYYLDAKGADGARVAGVGAKALPLSFLVVSKAELAEGIEGDGLPLWIPIAIGGGVAGVVVVAGVSAVAAFILLQPSTGSATVTVRQESP